MLYEINLTVPRKDGLVGFMGKPKVADDPALYDDGRTVNPGNLTLMATFLRRRKIMRRVNCTEIRNLIEGAEGHLFL